MAAWDPEVGHHEEDYPHIFEEPDAQSGSEWVGTVEQYSDLLPPWDVVAEAEEYLKSLEI